VTIKRFQIRKDKFKDCPDLQEPLNQALVNIQDDLAAAVDGLVKLLVLPAVDLVVSSNTPGTSPWPLRLGPVAGSVMGIALLRVENLTTSGSNGVPTSAVSVTSMHVEGGQILVDFVSGLTLNARYRLRFGAYSAS
jgi:hypothetical protein